MLYKIIRWHSECVLIAGHIYVSQLNNVKEKMKILVFTLYFYIIILNAYNFEAC